MSCCGKKKRGVVNCIPSAGKNRSNPDLSNDMHPFLSQPSVFGCFAFELLSSPVGIHLVPLMDFAYTNNTLNISMT